MAIVFIISLICIAFAQSQFSVDVVPCPNTPIVTYTRSMPVGTIQVLYTNLGHILHLDDNHEVTVSVDNGASWKEVEGLGKTKIRTISHATGPQERHVLFIGFGTSKRIWVSEDGGLRIGQHVDPPAPLSNFRWHATASQWVIATTIPGCASQRNTPECSYDLYFSSSGGRSWALLRKYVWDAQWHKGGGAVKNNIVVWERKLKTGNQFESWSPTAVVKSDSFFRTDETQLADNVMGFLCLENHIFIAKSSATYGSFQLLSSTDMGEHFSLVRFPETLQQKGYSILDVSEGSSFISVAHGRNWGNIYAGDSSDNNFVLSLPKGVRSIQGAVPVGTDFRGFKGLEGVYIANRWKTVPPGGLSMGSGLETVVSFDKGGEWQLVKTKTGQQLNLLGPAEEKGGFYSREDAVGIMFSSGNVGDELQMPHDLYFTRDGGATWTWTANGSHTYEIGNKGGLVVAAKDEVASSTYKYSLTEGATWGDCPIFGANKATTKAELENIISDPHMKSRHFITWGDIPDGGAVLSVLDFSKVHERDCTGEDYERWEPSDREFDECLLGRHVVYKRRKQTAKCFLPADFDPAGEFVSNCSCTTENYMCEFCYIRDEKTEICYFDAENPLCAEFSPERMGNLSCTPGQLVFTTKGYRKVPGDSCDPWRKGSVNLLPTNYTCGGDPNGPGAGGIFVLVMLSIILVTVGVLWWLAATNERVRAALATVIPANFLPDARSNVPNAQYSALGGGDLEAFDSDARELPMGSESESEASATSP